MPSLEIRTLKLRMLLAVCVFVFLVGLSIHYLSPVSTALVNEQTSETLWSKTYGSGGAYDVIETSDGGYAVIGPSQASGGGYLLVKINSDGDLQWQKTFSNDYVAYPKSIVGTADGGYAIAGSAGYAGDNYVRIWLVKTDAEGNLQWEKTYGDDCGVSEANCLVETLDGGYAIVGDYASFTGLDGWEFLFVKTDSAGNLQWSKTYGKQDDDRANCIVRTNDGGYAIVGCTSRPGNTPLFWLVKTDTDGNMQWNKNYTNSLWNWAYSAVQTSDGGFALAGIASSEIGGAGSFWLVKTDSVGNIQWNKTFGNNADWVGSVIQTSDSGYAISGRDSNFQDSNFQVVKTDAEGNLQWRHGVTGPAVGNAIIQARDGNYVIAGQYNLNDGTIITNYYFWVTKIGPDGEAPAGTQTPAVTPTPTIATPAPSQLPVPDQSAFSVKSNSTVAQLFFNSTSSELSFTVIGPAGTAGYVKVTIAKSLVSSVQSVKVYLDGSQLNVAITEDVDAWLLSFTYLHSTHRVMISLATNPASTTFLSVENWVWIGMIIILVVVGAGLLFYFKKRKK
jgi:hypothetical protein